MTKSKAILISSVILVFIATSFLWLGKSPFIVYEAIHSYLSYNEEAKQTDVFDVESTEIAATENELDAYDGSPYFDIMDDSTKAEDVYKSLRDLLPAITGPLELPVEGSTGWAAIAMPLYSEANTESMIITDFDAGQVFLIKIEQGQWWYVECGDGESGWVEHIACFINLPDVIPSIVYNITNAYSALTRSSGYEIPGVTGQKLYDAGPVYNPRLSRDEFIVPTLYSTSKLLFQAQQLALESGDTIILHEAYRDHASQQRSVSLLRELMDSNERVRSAIEDGPWSLNWFIATSLSNHQRGVAFDASLGKIISYEIEKIGEVFIPNIIDYEEYEMPTPMHELSPRAVALTRPVSSRSRDEWREIPPARTMTQGSKLLQDYFDKARMTPLASEWWHFNDLDGVEIAIELDIIGCFLVDDILSVSP